MEEPAQPPISKPDLPPTRLSKMGSAHHKLRSLVHKNYTWVVLVGSLIVSGTLTVRDNIRDKARDFNQSMETRRFFSGLGELGNRELLHIDQLNDKVDQLASGARRSDNQALTLQLNDQVVPLRRQLEQIDIDLISVSLLAELLPSEHFTEQEDFLARSSGFLKARIDALAKTEASRGDQPVKGGEATYERLVKDIDEYGTHAKGYRLMVESAAYRKAQAYERLYTLTTYLSYSLIAFGLALTITGRLIGKPGEAPEIKIGG